ncbi:MAG: hypothetical protein QXL94_01350 [Candidatus Parvarchaeum sp.]
MEKERSNKEYMKKEIEEFLQPDVLARTFFIPNEKLDMSVFEYHVEYGREGEAAYKYKGKEVYFNTFRSEKGMSFDMIGEDEHFLEEAERLGFLLRR